MQAYLFVHFREKTTPDGEQVYFGVSKDGFNWEEVNGGAPVLWAYYGDKGVRDFTVTRCKNPQTGKEKFVILATDLSLSYGMRGQYHHSWDEIGHNGSKSLAIWESDGRSSVLQRLETNSLAVCGHQMLFMIKRQKIMLCTGLLLMQEIITVKKQFFIAAQRILKNFQSRKFYMIWQTAASPARCFCRRIMILQGAERL